MRVSTVVVVLVLACWTTVKSDPIGAGLLAAGLLGAPLLGLAALRAFWLFLFGRRFLHGKRSVDDPTLEEKNALLSTVSELDQDGCIRKMLCQLQTKEETSRTLEEKLLAKLFTNSSTENITPYNAAFVYATDIGIKTRNAAVCEKVFNKCSVGDLEMSDLLQKTWGCPSNLSQ
ncbi:uncharacterized protein [Cherax quadricarinatus]|uniref:uncharacterized protein n=1 Tax=Cherax quadricarinatus TaxID=27406 RepID=UPI00387E75C9